jgi:hypothetical protein
VEEALSSLSTIRGIEGMRAARCRTTHSKKLENHGAAIALHFAHDNFARIHSTLRCTPAMATGIATTVWTMDDLLSAALEGVRP